MDTLFWIAGITFLVWIALGLMLKTCTPFREVLYRTRVRARPVAPAPKCDRFDLDD